MSFRPTQDQPAKRFYRRTGSLVQGLLLAAAPAGEGCLSVHPSGKGLTGESLIPQAKNPEIQR